MLLSLRRTALVARPLPCSPREWVSPHRGFAQAAALSKNLQLPPRPKVDEAEIEEKFLKGSGPGGQKINKTSSAVQLHHVPSGTVVKSQATRSRIQNRKIARQLLAEKLEVEEKGEESRTALKAQVKIWKKASAAKKSKRKYRALDEAKRLEPERSGKAAGGKEEMTSSQQGEVASGAEVQQENSELEQSKLDDKA